MYITNIFRILGLLLVLFSLTLLPPALVAIVLQEISSFYVFLLSAFSSLVIGFILWFSSRHSQREVRSREGFLIVTLIWLVLAVVSALPFAFSENPNLSFIDALFESISGLTTTGATVLTKLDSMPRAILYYRQQLQFIGGGGIILLGIAILPLLGVGGMQLFRAEMPGPFKEDKLTPRIAQTAKTLWLIYVGLVVICALSYWVAGMTFFDAIGHSFSTISTGGFSTHDNNIAFYRQPAIQLLGIIFMILGAVNFSLHYIAIRGKSLQHYWHDLECRAFLYVLFIITIIVAAALLLYKYYSNTETALLETLFHVVSFCTTTGFYSVNYSVWPTFVPTLLILICLIGGCAGSTAGGFKMIRALIIYKQWNKEIHRLIHPNGHYVIKLGFNRLNYRTLDAVWGFFGIFVAVFALFLVLLMATGLDFLTAFSGLSACISSTGLGLGGISDHFQSLNDSAKVLLSIAMLVGRLEFFTILVLLTPSYWKN